jgi:beta-amylase
VLAGRTALQAYTDFMAAFSTQFSSLLGSVVTDADVGLGPLGELRYPSTPLDSRWAFPGIGEFQVCLCVRLGGRAAHSSARQWRKPRR